jgi:tripeptide aminopeptidase
VAAGLPNTPGAPTPSPAVVAPAYLEEVEALAGDPGVREAFRVIEELEPRTLRDLVTLTEIPAPPFHEEARARAFLEMLREAGVDSAYLDAEGNAVGVRRGTEGGRVLALSGHLDTVFPPGTDVTVRWRGDTLYAPGVGDDTRGLVVVLAVLRALNAAELRTAGDVWFVGTVGEEGLGDLRGVKHLFREGGPRIDAFISIDGAGTNRVVNQALGSRRYRTTFRGPGGHSWGAFGLANPAHALGGAVALFDREAAAFVASGARTSYNVGVIGGGTSVNAIPYEAWMEVDMRSVDAGRLLELDALFRSAVQRALADHNAGRSRGEPLSVELDLVGDRPSGGIAPETPFVQRAMASIRHFGWEPELQRSSTDANVPISLGIPAVTLGGGGVGGGAHSLDEWWLNVDGHLAIQRTLLLVLAEAGLSRR